jgi:hypothetical protein
MAQLAENAKVAGQLDIVGNVGGVSRHVAAGGLGKWFAGREIQVDIAAQPVDRAALLMGNFAQSVPGGVFEKDIVVAVESIFIVNKAPVGSGCSGVVIGFMNISSGLFIIPP